MPKKRSIVIFRAGRSIGTISLFENAAPSERWEAREPEGRSQLWPSRRAAIRCLEGWAGVAEPAMRNKEDK